MKVVVLGGAGVMGSYAAIHLVNSGIFSNVIIADLNEEKGKELAKQYGMDFVKIDATSEESVREAIKGASIAINAVGPFYKFALPILKTVIKEGINYVDICDDYDVTQKLLELDEMAKGNGTAAIIGLGASPGITNVAAAYGASMLDEVKSIKIYVTRSIKEEAGGAIPYHMLHAWLGNVPAYLNGKYEIKKGLRDGKEHIKFPEPFGELDVYYFGHPETITLPRYINVRNVECKGNFTPPIFRNFLISLDELGFISDEKLSIGISPIDFLAAFIQSKVKSMSGMEDVPEGGAVMVAVNGKKDGKDASYAFSGIARMREATATPAAIAAIMMAKGEISFSGVRAPEVSLPHKKFINEMIKSGIFHKIWMEEKKEIEELK